ncbi:hypothetical protein [Treponema phagedenis]|uniref:hypothetical protein n=1 Tax=Treponema phagedenis TaxID=162 RepID=UPI0001F64180|nr:hypothetical protein [Treponema phagedenis]EFW38301.1 hypothetical protein HMPREF9554_01199 [Treponema phagedenis F0421]TYT78077.1 hypothetical protein FS559_02510 [Treponema phagedenis]
MKKEKETPPEKKPKEKLKKTTAAKTSAAKKSVKKEASLSKNDVRISMETFDVGDAKLTEKEKRFVFWYTYPGSDAFMVQARAADLAGYKSPTSEGYRLRKKDTVAKAIRYVLDTNIKKDLDEEYYKILELKKRRIHYDLADYVKKEQKTIITKEGIEKIIEIEELKDLQDLTPQQRQVIDGLDLKGGNNTWVYIFADRDKAMADIIRIREKLLERGQGDEGDNIEFVAEIIKEGLALKVSARNKKRAISESADFLELSNEGSEEF